MSRKRFEVFIRVLDCFNCMTQAALITLIHLLGNSTEGLSAYIYKPLWPDFGCRRAMLEYRVVSGDVGNISRPGRIGGRGRHTYNRLHDIFNQGERKKKKNLQQIEVSDRKIRLIPQTRLLFSV